MGVAVLLGVFIWYGMQPIKGTIHVGICRTFIEMTLEYPRTMKLTALDYFEATLRIYYTYADPFGQARSDVAECTFNPDTTLKAVRIHRADVPQDKVQAFNATIPFIVSANPDLIVPPPPSENLSDLKRD